MIAIMTSGERANFSRESEWEIGSARLCVCEINHYIIIDKDLMWTYSQIYYVYFSNFI